jgi:hypothetical protein
VVFTKLLTNFLRQYVQTLLRYFFSYYRGEDKIYAFIFVVITAILILMLNAQKFENISPSSCFSLSPLFQSFKLYISHSKSPILSLSLSLSLSLTISLSPSLSFSPIPHDFLNTFRLCLSPTSVDIFKTLHFIRNLQIYQICYGVTLHKAVRHVRDKHFNLLGSFVRYKENKLL